MTVAYEGSGQNVTTTPKFRMYASYRSKCMIPATKLLWRGGRRSDVADATLR